MMSRCLLLTAGVCLVLFGMAAACWPAEETPALSWEKYKVLVDRNMFLPERSSGARRTYAPSARAEAPAPESYITLTGVVRQGEEWVAFLEDRRAGATTKARAGESIADGRITAITLDRIEYEKNGQAVSVEVGQTLQGASASSLPAVTPAATGAAPAAAAGPVVGADAKSILERLRQRRQQELERQ